MLKFIVDVFKTLKHSLITSRTLYRVVQMYVLYTRQQQTNKMNAFKQRKMKFEDNARDDVNVITSFI